MTQTPASGPSALVTTPARSFAPGAGAGSSGCAAAPRVRAAKSAKVIQARAEDRDIEPIAVSLQDRALASGRPVRQPPKDRTEQGGRLRGHFPAGPPPESVAEGWAGSAAIEAPPAVLQPARRI